MSNPEVSAYISHRLQDGDSPANIAARLHAWGYRLDNSRAPSRLSSQTAQTGPTRTISLILGVSMLFILSVGSIAVLQRSDRGAGSTSVTIDGVTTQANAPATLAQPPTTTHSPTQRESAVLSAQIDLEDTNSTSSATISARFDLDDDPSGSKPKPVSQSQYTIAIMGDSMIDTLDSHFEQLSEEFEKKYDAEFKVYNYGVGAENAAMALERFSQPLDYKGRNHLSIPDLKPDILIIGSFAYNPFENHDLNNYWIRMAELVDAARQTGADVYMLAEVAPVREKFALGSLEWTVETRSSHAQKIVDQFNSFINLASALNAPLIDAYTPTQSEDGFGNGAYTSLTDGIHANTAGKLLMLDTIIETVEIE